MPHDATHSAARSRLGREAVPRRSSGPTTDPVCHRPTPPPPAPPLPDGDEELFRLYAEAGSERALREIVNRYRPQIMRLFLRNPATRSRAEDLTQEVFIRIIRNRASYDPRQRFSTWSKTIAERIAINAARGARRSRIVSFSDIPVEEALAHRWDLDPPDPKPLPDELAEFRQRDAMLVEALSHVEPKYRVPTRLHYLEGLTHTETARRLGIPVGTAKSRTHYAIMDLREMLAGSGLGDR